MADYAKERKERKDREADRVAQDAWNKKQDKHEADKVEWRKRARSDQNKPWRILFNKEMQNKNTMRNERLTGENSSQRWMNKRRKNKNYMI